MKNEFPKHQYIVEKHLNKVSNINKLRQGKHGLYFEKMDFVLLSGTSIVFEISKKLKEVKSVPLATSLEFMTNKFWLLLNKNFGNSENIPKAFNILTKAKVILCNGNNVKLERTYEELKSDFSKGTKSIEQFKSNYVAIRSSLKTPEEITVDNVDEVYSIITEDEFDFRKCDIEYLQRTIKDGEKLNSIQLSEINDLSKFKEKYEKLDNLLQFLKRIHRFIQNHYKTWIINLSFIFVGTIIVYKFSDNAIFTGALTIISFLVLYNVHIELDTNSEK